MEYKIKSSSVFNYKSHKITKFFMDIDKDVREKSTMLIINGNDGYDAIPFANLGFNIDCYEDDEFFLNSRINGNIKHLGLIDRVRKHKLNKKINIIKENYYTKKVENQYDYVFCMKSLNLDINKSIPLKRKLRKLQSSVKYNGYIYIYYLIAADDNDYQNYPENQFFRKNEIIKYFDNSWNLISSREDEIIRNVKESLYKCENKDYYFGYIIAQKKNLEYKYHYDIYSKLSLRYRGFIR